MNTASKIERIKAALKQHIEDAKEATPGPWHNESDWSSVLHGAQRVVQSVPKLTEKTKGPTSADCVFIAFARTMSPAACRGMLVAIDELEACHIALEDGNDAAWEAIAKIEATFPEIE